MTPAKQPHWMGLGEVFPKIRYPRHRGLVHRLKKLFTPKEVLINGPQEKRS